MTYNIRLNVDSDGENAWPERKDFLMSQVLFLEPDVLGVQEAKPNQIQDLNQKLLQYTKIGEGRRGNGQGEHSSIYYNHDKLDAENVHTFWLSETPDSVSKGWGASHYRICTYALFTNLKSKDKFWVFNTHLDHRSEAAQKEGISLILQEIKKVNKANYPVFLMGDLNVEPDNEVISKIKMDMNDPKDLANIVFGPEGTFNGFRFHEPVTRRIDYIFISKDSGLKVLKHAVFSSNVQLKYPSDHFPVFIEVAF